MVVFENVSILYVEETRSLLAKNWMIKEKMIVNSFLLFVSVFLTLSIAPQLTMLQAQWSANICPWYA